MFRTKNKIESHKKTCEYKDFCGAVIVDKTPSIIYANLEFLIKITDGCKNNFGKSSTIKVDEHIPCGYSMSTIRTCDGIENKCDVYRCEDCKIIFLREHAMKIIQFEMRNMIPLTKEEYESYLNQTSCNIYKKITNINTPMIKNIIELEIIVIIQVNIEVLLIVYVI